MKLLGIVLIVMFFGIAVYLFILGILSKQGQSPGLVDGKLTACSIKPNCVCSEYVQDSTHFIEPLSFSTGSQIMPVLKRFLIQLGGEVVEEQPDYIAATFSSSLFGFVDDFESRIDVNNKQIHFRSASRVGRSDFGQNKKRVMQLSRQLETYFELLK